MMSTGTDTRAGMPKQKASVNGRQIAKDSITFSTQRPVSDITTGAGTQAFYVLSVDPISASTTTIASNYNEYKAQRFIWRYRPSVGVNTSGRIWAAYFQNPEIGYGLASGAITTANAVLATKFAADVKTWAVHQPFDYVIPTSMRQRQYDINSSISSVADYARSIMGVLVIFSEGCPSSSTLGTQFLECTAVLYGLSNATYAPTLASTAGEVIDRVVYRPYKPAPLPDAPTTEPVPPPEAA